jgi:hypothetical protein
MPSKGEINCALIYTAVCTLHAQRIISVPAGSHRPGSIWQLPSFREKSLKNEENESISFASFQNICEKN